MRARTLLLAGLLIGLFSLPLQAQDADEFLESVREIDPHAEMVVDVELQDDGIAAVAVVGEHWNALDCQERREVAGTLRVLWERAGGEHIVVHNRPEQLARPSPARPDKGVLVKGCV